MGTTERLDLEGPVADVALLDAVWQDQPVWTGNDGWTTVRATLAYEGPPYPGVLVRANVPPGRTLGVSFGDSLPPGGQMDLVLQTELVFGEHGLVLETETAFHRLAMPSGNYDLGVWVQPVGTHTAKAIAFVFGPRRERRIGPPKS